MSRPPLPPLPPLASSLDFFTPAATSFKPRPYTLTAVDSLTTPSAPRSMDSHPPSMDPLSSDPAVVFIHPPFVSFPNSHLHPDGLTFQLMTENPNWFLVPTDFVSVDISDSNLIPYPPHLEPPRGWCPAKKKDLKDRGSDGWPEGEEPRLRCTFCRRTYAGVNAKSMWRRHVFEKHKIAMSNRRDGSDRPRGRGSNKENRHVISRPRPESHDSLVNLDIAPQTDPRNVSHKSKFRSLFSAAEESRNRRVSARERNINLRLSADPAHSRRPSRHSSKPALPPSPPLTPQSSAASDPLHAPFEPATSDLSATLPVVPSSPYDPLLTPTFRHSPPRLPSDQPWRFPSPSHPLHSRARELSLGMLIREANTPMKGLPVFSASPGLVQSSPVPTSRALKEKRRIFEMDTPESIAKSSGPSPRALFLRDHPPTPLGTRIFSGKARHRIAESPLHRDTTSAARRHAPLESADNWLSEVSLMPSASSLTSSPLLTSSDPFVTIYSSWGPIVNCEQNKPREFPSSPLSGPEIESPILRNTALPSGAGLGIGLLGPFSLPEDTQGPAIDFDSDFTDMLTYPLPEEEHDKIPSDTAIASCYASSPPTKKRKMTIDSLD